MEHTGLIEQSLAVFLQNYHESNVSWVKENNGAPSALEFARIVGRNEPVVFRGAVANWRAIGAWNRNYLSEKMGERPILVAETPDGRADAHVLNPADGVTYFVKPHVSEVPFNQFMDYLVNTRQRNNNHVCGVKYSQSQDDNIHTEYSPLASDIEEYLPWAHAGIEGELQATNLWIGNEKSVTSLHRDVYENLYCQISGVKTFVLVSPYESIHVKERPLPQATYEKQSVGKFEIIPSEPPEKQPHWPTVGMSDGFSNGCRPLRVSLQPGDVLYLPALWYHQVSQSCSEEGICCAVNYWYDMDFTASLYHSVDFVRSIAAACNSDGQRMAI
ncbi:cupin-like domain-containing protein [Geopyxis carbonaria]|nr:cupin-like domain-containing protein [Geopyxis carbonaria]